MSRRTTFVILSTAALGAVIGGALWRGRPAQQAPEPTRAPAPGPALRVEWPAGARALYTLAWTAHTSGLGLAAPAQTVDAESALAAELAIEALGPGEGGALLALSLPRVTRASFRMHGQPGQGEGASRAALEGHRAYVTVSPRGEVRGVRFDPAAPPAVQEALRALALQLHMVLPEGGEGAWEAVEPVGSGTMRRRYRRSGGRIVREPAALVSLDVRPGGLPGTQALRGAATIAIEGGRLSSIEDEEDWSYTSPGEGAPLLRTRFSFRLTRKAEERFDPAALRARLPSGPERRPGAPVQDPGLPARRDARLAEGVTDDQLLAVVNRAALGERPKGSLANVAAYLRLHPEASRLLLGRFADDSIGLRGRGMILDLLAQAGDARAQAAMREALSRRDLKLPPGDHGLLIQRFTLLGRPTRESAEFLERELLRTKQGPARGVALGAAASLGAVADQLREAGQDDLAQRANGRLQRELGAARDPALQRALIAGLGNAARAENVPHLVRFAGSEDARVRAEVASALRSVDDTGARAALLRLAADRASGVSTLALTSLKRQTLAPGDWRSLSALIGGGRTPSSADGSVVELVRARRDAAGAEGDAILRALQRRNDSADNDLQVVIRDLLAKGPGAAG